MKSAWALALFLAASPCVHAMDVTGLHEPESIFKDPATGSYFISNVNGDPLDKDQNGFITKISPGGDVVVLKFIQTEEDVVDLHAPKGLLVRDGILFVADVDALKGFDVNTGEMKYYVDLEPKPEFLNDIAVGWEGRLYVSDMSGNRIYQVDPEKNYEVSVFKEGEELGQPNGLLFNEHERRLIVATWQTGSIMDIDVEGNLTVLREGLENLDGMAADRQGNLYVSSFTKGEIYRIDSWGKGDLSLFETGLTTPADIFFDDQTKELIVPLMKASATVSFDTSSAQTGKFSTRPDTE